VFDADDVHRLRVYAAKGVFRSEDAFKIDTFSLGFVVLDSAVCFGISLLVDDRVAFDRVFALGKRMMNFDPADRPQPEEALQELDTILKEARPIAKRRTTRKSQRTRSST
jgi:hypothetical protein